MVLKWRLNTQRQNFQIISSKFDQNIAIINYKLLITSATIISLITFAYLNQQRAAHARGLSDPIDPTLHTLVP